MDKEDIKKMREELEMLEDVEYAKQYLTDEGVDVEEEQELAAKYMKKIRDKVIEQKGRVQAVINQNI